METNIPSSFIPHDTAQAGAATLRERSAGLPEFVLLVSIVLFVASVALAGGVFLYAQYLNTTSASKVEQLQRAKEAFDPALIERLMRVSDRIHAADQVLSRHLAPSTFFEALQAATLSTVSFSTLDLQADSALASIKMTGIAQSVNSIALQADLFSKNGIIKDPIFSGIDREKGGVHFALTAELDRKAVSFSQQIHTAAMQAAGAATPAAQEESSPFGTIPRSGNNAQ